MHILLLAYYHPRYIKPLKQWGELLHEKGWNVTEMYPNAFYKEDVLEEFSKDYDVIVYFGHGMPGAWCGFGFISAMDFIKVKPKSSSRIIFCFCCHSMSSKNGNCLGKVFIENSLATLVLGYNGWIKYEKNLEILERTLAILLSININDCDFDSLKSAVSNINKSSVKAYLKIAGVNS